MPALRHPLAKRVPEASAAVLALLIAIATWEGFQLVHQIRWVQHTLDVRTEISRIWTTLQDAEIAQRTFVLTGEELSLATYIKTPDQLKTELDNLHELIGDNPDQLSNISTLQSLIADRLAAADRTVEARRKTGLEAARDAILNGQGVRLQQALHDQIEMMLAGETALLKVRSDRANQAGVAVVVTLIFGALATFAVLATWIVWARRSAQELAGKNAALETLLAERDAAEQQLRQMQKMEAVGQLTGGIAHDFNNMLAIIVAGIELAQRRLASNREGVQQYLQGALDGATRAGRLVARLLAFSRQQPLTPRPLDPNKFVSGMSELIARALGPSIHMETVLGGGLWTTFVDAAQLESSILNLCVNARDAMPAGGRLTLETANCYLDNRYSSLHAGVPPGQYVLIAVSDTGAGMDAETLKKAFEPFFTTKGEGKGTGLGLAQVYGFVKQSGGHIKIYSEVNQGTTVKIYLPRYRGEAAKQTDTPSKTAGPETSGETVLLVDDDPKLLELTAASIKELGYNVVTATDARGALAAVADGMKVDLLLTDIVMPEMNGRQLVDKVRIGHPDMRVLYMTGFTRNAIVHNGMLDPGLHLLAKPFTQNELAAKLREAINGKAI